MLFGNFNLLIFRVTGNANDFHAVEQRHGNVERIGGGDEHDIGQVVIDFHVMIGKCAVLLRVKHLKQRR